MFSTLLQSQQALMLLLVMTLANVMLHLQDMPI